MDFKSMINKIESIDGPIETPKAPVLPEAVRLDEDTEFRVLAGLQPLTESLVMEKKLTAAEKEKKEEVVKSMKKDKADFKKRYGEKGEEVMHATATKIAKKKAEGAENNNNQVSEDWPGTPEYKAKHGSDKEKHMAKYGTDPEDAKEYEEKKKKGGYGNLGPSGSESDSEVTKKGKKSKKDESLDPKFLEKFESMDEFGDEGPEDLLSAVEREIKNPGQSIDNLIDVQNATFGSDDSPEFEKARRIIEKYIEFVTNTDVDHYDDDEDPDHEDEPMIRRMRHDNIQKHIREYDLGDYLVSAIHELKKAVGKSESFNRRAFESKFARMVEAKKQESKKTIKGKKSEEKMDEASKPDFLDVDKDGDKKEPMKKAAAEKGRDKKDAGKKGMTAAQAKYFGKKKTNESQVDEFFYFDDPSSKKKDTGHDELARRQKKGAKTTDPSYKQKDDPRYGGQYKIKGPKGKLPESQRGSKKTVKESIEPKMSFRDMMKLVVESGGQQQIDPLDKTLFAWATRVAENKLGEGTKAEVYAGLVYERMGGRFEMYDVLSENRLDEDWRKKLGAAAMAGIMGLGAMGGASAADMPGKDIGSDKPVAQVNAYKSMMEVEREVQDLAKVDKQAAKSYEATKSYYNKLLGKAKSSEDMKEIDKEYTKSLQTIIKLSTNATPGGG